VFPDRKYDIIYADPPWQYNNAQTLHKTSLLNGKLNIHYSTMTTDDICNLPVQSICNPDCLLFMWVVSPMITDGLRVIEA